MSRLLLFPRRSPQVLLTAAIAAISFAHPAAGDDTFRNAYGRLFKPFAEVAQSSVPVRIIPDPLRRWNQIAIDASGLDHTPVAEGEVRTFGEQLGPGRASRAMAIVHIAMADVVSATTGAFSSYTGVTSTAGSRVSQEAAISQAAHDTLVALFPSQTAKFNEALAIDLLGLRESDRAVTEGLKLGRRVAIAIITQRAGDGVLTPEPHVGIGHLTSNLPGRWRKDPISLIPLALGGHWGECVPFVIGAPSDFRTPPPPAMSSAEYTAAFNEVKKVGGDGINTPTKRTPEQTFVGTFWAYDGTPSLCAPPRLYNQIVMQIAGQQRLNRTDLARLLALVNVAMADTGYAAWESKYHWDFWRPVGGVREADPGTGPTGAGDGNPDTIGDVTFMPLGAPASNLMGPNFTPPFPAYPSGHAAFGGALFQTLRQFFGTDEIPFLFVSDEYNGVTRDNAGNVRPYLPRLFLRLSQAEEENGQSRIYLGIHWVFDKTAGIAQGRQIADYVFRRAFVVPRTADVLRESR